MKRWFQLVCSVLCAPLFAHAASATIDALQYPGDGAAQMAWQPMRGTAPATTAVVDGRHVLRLPCNFAGTTFERASWDHKVALDLSACRGVQFDFRCTNTAPVAQFSIYFQSGNGWYATTFQPEATDGWGTVTIKKTAMRVEGQPAGWNRISTIRISAWRGQDADTEMCLADLRRGGVLGADASIAVLRFASGVRLNQAETRSFDQFAEAVADGFESLGLGCATPGDLEVSAELLRDAKLVVLPMNPTLPSGAATAIVDYARGGGKLLVFYELPPELRAVVPLEIGSVVKSEPPSSRFAAIQFKPGALPGAPPLVRQRSWNIRQVKPSPGVRVLADWADDQGRPAGEPAIVATPNCVMMTHVLLRDDWPNQGRMLLALAGSLVPDLWRQAAAASLARAGAVGGAKSFDEAVAAIARQAAGDPRAKRALASAQSLRTEALALHRAGKHIEAMDKAPLAAQQMLEAFCLAQKPAPGEFRAFWCHSAFGVAGIDWDEAIKRLADAGFTAILPNMLWGGVAFYPSKVLPRSGDVATRGDQIAQCLAACRKYGVQIHVWKVNWNTGRAAPRDFLNRMRDDGRLQVSSKGQPEPWLCPSHPENQALEIASMVEVARDYDVDGIHFDYIRYPDGDHCFCEGCRQRFAEAVHAKINREDWPKIALAGGEQRQPWLEWRRSNITTVVRAVSEQARAVKPRIKISAAVFRNWVTDRDGVGQDWKLWCERGWLDFICPMDYTDSDRQFDNWVALQKEWAGRTPVYPGIGVSASNSRLTPDRTIGQIEIARRHGTGGFTIFNYGVPESRDLLPMLALGATRRAER